MITLAITNWNRDLMTFDSFIGVYEDPLINEIVIVDDCSHEYYYNNLHNKCKDLDKVKLHRNSKNLGCYHNKRKAVELSNNDWVILFDSDNKMTSQYLDAH